MLPITRFLLSFGVLLTAAGGFLSCIGGSLLWTYLSHPPTEKPSTLEFILRVLAPHLLLLLGIGGVVFGIILLIRGGLFHRRIATHGRSSYPKNGA